MANGIFGTNTDILYINAGGAGDYSGTSGVFVDNVNRIITLTGDYASAIPQISANSANIAELSSKFEDCCSSVQGDITNLSSSITNLSGDVINKLDISSFSAVSGNFLTAMPQGVMYEDRLNYTDDLSALSGYNGIPFSVTDLSDYYKKTETSSKEEISAALENIPEYILNGNSNITATSAQDGKNIRWDLRVAATPVVTDTTIVGESGVYAHETQIPGQWQVELTQSAYSAINEVSNKLDKSFSSNFYPMTGNPSAFVVSTELANYQTIAGMTGYATTGDLPDMSLYYLKTETSSKTEISDGLNTKQNNLTFHYIEV